MAIKFKADGIYIPSFNKRITLNKASLDKNFKIIGSAHNQMEIKKKIDQGCEVIFLSPIFRIEKSKKYLGVCKFGLLTLKYRRKFIALGVHSPLDVTIGALTGGLIGGLILKLGLLNKLIKKEAPQE